MDSSFYRTIIKVVKCIGLSPCVLPFLNALSVLIETPTLPECFLSQLSSLICGQVRAVQPSVDRQAALWTDKAKPPLSILSHSTLPMPHPQGHCVKLLDLRPCVNVRAVQPSVVETAALGWDKSWKKWTPLALQGPTFSDFPPNLSNFPPNFDLWTWKL